MLPLDDVFARLAKSPFRRKFRLQGRELAYLQTWGLPHVMKQAADLIGKRLAPAVIPNDGRHELDAAEREHVLAAIERWLHEQAMNDER